MNENNSRMKRKLINKKSLETKSLRQHEDIFNSPNLLMEQDKKKSQRTMRLCKSKTADTS